MSSDDLKTLNKRIRSSRAKRLRAEEEHIELLIEKAMRFGSDAAVEEEAPAAPHKPKAEKPKKKAKPDATPFNCAGNVLTGDACATPTAAPAAQTKHEGKKYDSCKTCKNAIRKSKKATAPADAAAAE